MMSVNLPTTPTHDTQASGLPTTLSNAASCEDKRSALFHSTFFVHSSPAHHFGTEPDLLMLVTFAPLSTNNLQTRLPAKPVPPKTVTDRDDTRDNMLHSRMIVVSIEVIIIVEEKRECQQGMKTFVVVMSFRLRE